MRRHVLELAPALLCFAYFLGGVPLFWLRTRQMGPRREPAIERRRPSPVIPKWLIYYLLWIIAPIERGLVRARISPSQLTALGLLLSCCAGAALAWGLFAVGGWLYLLAGITDIFDGRVARATGRASPAGAYFDSVVDRYSECAALAGLLLYYHGTWVVYPVVAVLCGSLLVSYARARAEGLGISDASVLGGAMQRPERIFLLGLALATAPFSEMLVQRPGRPAYLLVQAILMLLAVTTNFTALRRFLAAWRSLKIPSTRPHLCSGVTPAGPMCATCASRHSASAPSTCSSGPPI